MTLTLNIGRTTTYIDILKELNLYTDGNLTILLNFECNGFVSSSIYLIITSFILEKRAQGNIITIQLIGNTNCNQLNYASRANFFKTIGFDRIEPFVRRDTSTSLVPITNIPINTYKVSDEITPIFSKSPNLSEDDKEFITLLILEMICNTTIHSKTKSGAVYYLQKYNNLNTIEFNLIDNGIGIKESLAKNSKYQNLSNKDAIIKALEFEVTNGEGRGHGLFIMKEIIKKTGGSFLLISGENSIFIDSNKSIIRNTPNWDGVFLKINFKFGEKFSLLDFYKEIGYN